MCLLIDVLFVFDLSVPFVVRGLLLVLLLLLFRRCSVPGCWPSFQVCCRRCLATDGSRLAAISDCWAMTRAVDIVVGRRDAAPGRRGPQPVVYKKKILGISKIALDRISSSSSLFGFHSLGLVFHLVWVGRVLLLGFPMFYFFFKYGWKKFPESLRLCRTKFTFSNINSVKNVYSLLKKKW